MFSLQTCESDNMTRYVVKNLNPCCLIKTTCLYHHFCDLSFQMAARSVPPVPEVLLEGGRLSPLNHSLDLGEKIRESVRSRGPSLHCIISRAGKDISISKQAEPEQNYHSGGNMGIKVSRARLGCGHPKAPKRPKVQGERGRGGGAGEAIRSLVSRLAYLGPARVLVVGQVLFALLHGL